MTMENENTCFNLKIHYCFTNNDSHSMDAFVRNRAEKEFLEVIRSLSELLDAKIKIKTQAYKEGSLIEVFDVSTIALFGFGIAALKYFSPTLNEIAIKLFTSRTVEGKLDVAIKQETLKGLMLENAEKAMALSEKIKEVSLNSKIRKNVSNYYKQIKGLQEVESVEFIDGNNESINVSRSAFDMFIISDTFTTDIDDEAEIEIISPVLKDGTYEWKGVYREQRIQFSMGDSKFKQDVVDGKYSFANGFTIKAQLAIASSFNVDGELKKQTFSVRKVYATQEADVKIFADRPLGKKKKIKKEKEASDKRQGLLFDDFNNGESQ